MSVGSASQNVSMNCATDQSTELMVSVVSQILSIGVNETHMDMTMHTLKLILLEINREGLSEDCICIHDKSDPFGSSAKISVSEEHYLN